MSGRHGDGRIQARHPQVADLYEMEVVEEQGCLRLYWNAIENQRPGTRRARGPTCRTPICQATRQPNYGRNIFG